MRSSGARARSLRAHVSSTRKPVYCSDLTEKRGEAVLVLEPPFKFQKDQIGVEKRFVVYKKHGNSAVGDPQLKEFRSRGYVLDVDH